MKAYSREPGVTSQDIEATLRALSVGEADVPVVAAIPGQQKFVFASDKMLALFGVADLADLSARLFAGEDPGAKRLAALSKMQDDAPRLERLSFSLGGADETLHLSLPQHRRRREAAVRGRRAGGEAFASASSIERDHRSSAATRVRTDLAARGCPQDPCRPSRRANQYSLSVAHRRGRQDHRDHAAACRSGRRGRGRSSRPRLWRCGEISRARTRRADRPGLRQARNIQRHRGALAGRGSSGRRPGRPRRAARFRSRTPLRRLSGLWCDPPRKARRRRTARIHAKDVGAKPGFPSQPGGSRR